jgi:hypothetical protein
MLGKKLGKPYDRMGYKLSPMPMVMGGKMNHKYQTSQMHEMPMMPMKPMNSDLEKYHSDSDNEQRRPRHRH